MSRVQDIAEALRKGDPLLCKAIDCSYVERLMWNIKDSASRRWAWNAFPEIIRQYYERMWGPVHF